LCAARELTEETGYRAERVERVGGFFTAPGFCTEWLTAYVARGLTHVGQDLDDTEQIEVHAVTLREALAMARDNRICDAKSLSTLLWYHAFAREGR
jgi:ADP-ribose pyrophosphatase